MTTGNTNDHIIENLVAFMLVNHDWKNIHFDGHTYTVIMKDGTEMRFGGEIGWED